MVGSVAEVPACSIPAQYLLKTAAGSYFRLPACALAR